MKATSNFFISTIITLLCAGIVGCSSEKKDDVKAFLTKCKTSFMSSFYTYKATTPDGLVNCNFSLLAFYDNDFELDQTYYPSASIFSYHLSREDGGGRIHDGRGISDGKSGVSEYFESERTLPLPSIHTIRREQKAPYFELDINPLSLSKFKEFIASYKNYGSDDYFLSDSLNNDYSFTVDVFTHSISLKYYDQTLGAEIETTMRFMQNIQTGDYFPISIENAKTYFNTHTDLPITIISQFAYAPWGGAYYDADGKPKTRLFEVDKFEPIYEGDQERELHGGDDIDYIIDLSPETLLLIDGFVAYKVNQDS